MIWPNQVLNITFKKVKAQWMTKDMASVLPYLFSFISGPGKDNLMDQPSSSWDGWIGAF